MSLIGLIKPNYYKQIAESSNDFDCDPKTCNTLEIYIDEDGVLKIKNKRYMKLGKIELHDVIKEKPIQNTKYIGVLDTHTGKVLCFDIEQLYSKYLQRGEHTIHTTNGEVYSICLQTKKIVQNSINQNLF